MGEQNLLAGADLAPAGTLIFTLTLFDLTLGNRCTPSLLASSAWILCVPFLSALVFPLIVLVERLLHLPSTTITQRPPSTLLALGFPTSLGYIFHPRIVTFSVTVPCGKERPC